MLSCIAAPLPQVLQCEQVDQASRLEAALKAATAAAAARRLQAHVAAASSAGHAPQHLGPAANTAEKGTGIREAGTARAPDLQPEGAAPASAPQSKPDPTCTPAASAPSSAGHAAESAPSFTLPISDPGSSDTAVAVAECDSGQLAFQPSATIPVGNDLPQLRNTVSNLASLLSRKKSRKVLKGSRSGAV